MSRARFLVMLLCLGLLVTAHPGMAQVDRKAETIPSGATTLVYDWVFEVNQAADISTLDHRQLMVASGCDINGDGYDDVLVGDRDYDYLYTKDDNGRAWLFYGSSSGLSTSPDHIFNPPYTNYYGFFGTQVFCDLDVNGDGYDDIMIGMDNYDNSYSDEGAVFVWYGSQTGPTDSYNWMARGNATYAHFGISLDSAGDINGDTYDDIVVGAWRYDDNNIAHAYVWYGGASGLGENGTPANADWTASAPYPGQSYGIGFGRLVRGIGDVNGDTYDDVMVGAPNYSVSISNQGAVYAWYGSDSGLGANGTVTNADWTAYGNQVEPRFGMSGDGVGDLNGDGFDDLAVGAYYYDNPESNEGAVFVWYGTSSGLGDPGEPANADWMAEANVSSLLGFSLRSGGDVNDDGYADLLVAAPSFPVETESGTLTSAGAWLLWFGAPTGLGEDGIPENADLIGYGDQTSAYLGRDEIANGDVNGDGCSDIIAASRDYENGQTDEGAVFGYYSTFQQLYIPVILRETP